MLFTTTLQIEPLCRAAKSPASNSYRCDTYLDAVCDHAATCSATLDLQAQLNAKTVARKAGDAAFNDDLAKEVALRASQTAALNTSLNNEVAIRASQVASLNTSLSEEIH